MRIMKVRLLRSRGMNEEMEKLRLNRYLALCGLGSRRSVEDLIKSGRVKVNGKLAGSFYIRVGIDDHVEVDGRGIKPLKLVYLVFHKPKGCVCAVKDKHNTTIFSLLPEKYKGLGLFPVGRLDKMSEGLIILTNDGDFAFNITHPSSRITKTYEVLMNKPLSNSELMRLKKGTVVDGVHVYPKEVAIMRRPPNGQWVKIVLGEGRKREIRVIAQHADLRVVRLVRRSIGEMVLKDLPCGAFKEVSLRSLLLLIKSGGYV